MFGAGPSLAQLYSSLYPNEISGCVFPYILGLYDVGLYLLHNFTQSDYLSLE